LHHLSHPVDCRKKLNMDTTKLTIEEAKTLVAESLASRTGPPH
jgi:hypothetical protein